MFSSWKIGLWSGQPAEGRPQVELWGVGRPKGPNSSCSEGGEGARDGPPRFAGHHPSLPTFTSSSPVALLVGAAVSSQVKDEKALGEFICTQQREE